MTDVALITGTSSGMGLHAAVELARRGLHVVATMRDVGRATPLQEAAAAAGVEIDVRALDVVDHEAAARLVAEIEVELGGIHVLVNNAGQGSVATAEQLSMQQIQDQLDINYLAPVNLTKLVLPGMRERGNGRILTVTSVGGTVGQPFADAYCGAKFAVEGFMQSLAVVAERFGIRVSVIEPAAVASSFVANVVRPEEGGPYAALLGAYVSRTSGAFANAQTPESAGAAIAASVMSDEYRFRWQSSESATAFAGVSLADLDGERVLGFTRPWIAAS
ncbi:SDR family NAD(P)-dependent oxidoreductase [Microbacterium sp. 13-71-7]|jgi:short-subunit dehydrogenase|uniref:SDR family NAD(P)-dependent oxidoreductase n=1 Tax=Microbacterium sp. 13-71-7 TaxID=1970399 RepID=UPI000BD7355E|nr:SDR family NAD(P)-dependent oxidoreductase [Microbacterium sp. 13-71-7]OZB85572.1 MAG: short-chain dehydrogenase [Microbacterium sp. 13-71-7]